MNSAKHKKIVCERVLLTLVHRKTYHYIWGPFKQKCICSKNLQYDKFYDYSDQIQFLKQKEKTSIKKQR